MDIQGIYGLIVNEVIFKAFILSALCLIITYVHSFTYQYLLNKSFIFTSLMLSPLVLAVTTVISTNLYLSLGMIGALSIVRYRTPVKSQYELALLFSFICLGIIAGVNFKLSLKVFGLLIVIPLVYEFFIKKFFYSSLNSKNFEQSNNILLDLIINDTDTTDFIKKNNLINNLIKIETNNELKQTNLTIVFNEINEALITKKKLENIDKVKSISLSYA